MKKINHANAKEMVSEIIEALRGVGLGRNSRFTGGSNIGWIGADSYRSGDFWATRRREDPEHVVVGVTISGREAGLEYRTWVETQDRNQGPIGLHAPKNPEALYPKIGQVFEGLGYSVSEVRFSGAQEHWDDDVFYLIRVAQTGE